jgi:hypothetical protein
MIRRFGGTYHLHFQGRKLAEQETSARAGGRAEWAVSRDNNYIVPLLSCSADFRLWRWRRWIPPKHRLIYRLHGAISQKMAIFILKCWSILSKFSKTSFESAFLFHEHPVVIRAIVQLVYKQKASQYYDAEQVLTALSKHIKMNLL